MQSASSLSGTGRPAGHSRFGRWLLLVLALALAHVLVDGLLGFLARQATVSSGLAIGSGISLACMLRWGWRLWPAAFLSQVIGVVAVAQYSGAPLSMTGALGFGVAETVQDLLAWHLLHRWAREPSELSQPRDALLLVMVAIFLAAPVGALCSIATFFLAYEVHDATQLTGMWIDVWLVSARAILIGTPATLALLARPRQLRSARLLGIALPLLLATLLLFLAMSTVGRWDRQQQSIGFERDATRAAAALDKSLAQALQTLAATRGLLLVSPDADAFRAGAKAFMADPGGVRLVAEAGAALEQTPSDPLLPLRQVAHSGTGFNAAALAAPQWQAALRQAVQTGMPTMADAARTGDGRVQVALFHALDTEARTDGDEPDMPAPGVALVVIDVGMMLDAVLQPGMLACLIDEDTSTGQRQLAGSAGCSAPSMLQAEFRRQFNVADHHWSLRLYSASAVPFHNSPVAQLFGGLGLAAIGLLVFLLLTQSSRASRIEALVEQRTTELNRTLHALRLNQQRFRSVFDHAPVGVLIADLEGRPLDLNPALYRMLGYAAGERPDLSPLLGDGALVRQLVDSGQPVVSCRSTLIRQDDSVVEVQKMMSLLRDEQQRPEHLVCVIHDISDQIKAVEHERARTVADAANRAKSEFLARMSHELRTPLNGLLGFTQLLQLEREPLTATQRLWMERIGQAGWHLLAMINDVLDLSRVETGNLKVALEPQDAHALARECLTLLTPQAAERGISVRLTLDPAARYVLADATRVREILNNLLSNALKYNSPGGSVHLHLRRSGEAACVDFSVSDTGKGLSPEQLASLFQPFNRLGQERSSIEGTGIGLVITRRLAELMKGGITVESQPGLGSTFTLHLPASSIAPASDEPSGNLAPVDALPLGLKRLVYIEDNPVNIEVMKAIIGLRSELTLAVYEEGQAGLDALLHEPPDLVLLDMNLPDMDGLTLLNRLRARPQGARLPIVIVSADAMDEHIAAGLRGGAVHYLTKPFAVADLMQLLDKLLAP